MRQTVPLLALLLSGCAIDGTPRLMAVERAAPLPAALPVAFDGDAASEAGRVARALAQVLGTRVVPAGTADGPVLLVAAAKAPAGLGVAVEGKAGEPVRWLSPPRAAGSFDSCRAERLHASATAPDFAAHGEVDFCTLDQARIEALAQQLAQAVQGR